MILDLSFDEIWIIIDTLIEHNFWVLEIVSSDFIE